MKNLIIIISMFMVLVACQKDEVITPQQTNTQNTTQTDGVNSPDTNNVNTQSSGVNNNGNSGTSTNNQTNSLNMAMKNQGNYLYAEIYDENGTELYTTEHNPKLWVTKEKHSPFKDDFYISETNTMPSFYTGKVSIGMVIWENQLLDTTSTKLFQVKHHARHHMETVIGVFQSGDSLWYSMPDNESKRQKSNIITQVDDMGVMQIEYKDAERGLSGKYDFVSVLGQCHVYHVHGQTTKLFHDMRGNRKQLTVKYITTVIYPL